MLNTNERDKGATEREALFLPWVPEAFLVSSAFGRRRVGSSSSYARKNLLYPGYYLLGSLKSCQPSCRHEELSGIVWTATARNWTRRSHTSNIVRERLTERVLWTKPPSQSSLLNIYFRFSRVQSSLWRYVTLHYKHRSGAASLRYRNPAEITVLYMCEQKPHPVGFSRRRKSAIL